jgi:hypothetical protein
MFPPPGRYFIAFSLASMSAAFFFTVARLLFARAARASAASFSNAAFFVVHDEH